MSDPTIVTGYTDPSGVAHEVSTSDQALAGRFYLRRSSGQGRFAFYLFPAYQPTTDLLWLDPDASADLQPTESWPASSRPPLMNMGGHRAALVGESVVFDASFSDGDAMSDLSGLTWTTSDGGSGAGTSFTHVFSSAGSYTVTCSLGSASTSRYVRVVNDWNESDYDVVAIDALGATSDQGWSCALTVAGDATGLADYQGALLVYIDETEIAWRQSYDRESRRLAQSLINQTAYAADLTETSARSRVIFSGYLIDANSEATLDNTQTKTHLQLIGTGTMLDELSRRREVFWESAAANVGYGGTVMSAPMKIASCIHHSLVEHTNFASWHDALLDWMGPRLTSTSANEGTMWGAFRSWADNDFARLWSDKSGRLRYEPMPAFRGKSWFDQIDQIAIWVPSYVAESFQATERQLLHRTAWTKLCGANSTGNCEICAAYPCDGPAPGPAGDWETRRGLQYDDYTVLCADASYEFAYQNRGYDITITLPARHDLEINDIVKLPFKDPNGRFDWSVRPKLFAVTGISHQIDLSTRSWQTTIQAEELTTNVPCACPQPICPQQPGNDSTGSGGGTGTSTGTQVSCTVSPIEGSTVSYDTYHDSRVMNSTFSLTGERVSRWASDGYQTTANIVSVALNIFTFCTVSVSCGQFHSSDGYYIVDTGDDFPSRLWAATPLEFGDSDEINQSATDLTSLYVATTLDHQNITGTSGGSGFFIDRTVAYTELLVTGATGSTQKGAVEITILDAYSGGFFDVVLVDLDPSTSADSGVEVLLLGSEDRSTPLDGGAVIGVIGVLGTGDSGGITIVEGSSASVGDTLTFALSLAASPTGHHYRIGLRSVLGSGATTSNTVSLYAANVQMATLGRDCCPTTGGTGCAPHPCFFCIDYCGDCMINITGGSEFPTDIYHDEQSLNDHIFSLNWTEPNTNCPDEISVVDLMIFSSVTTTTSSSEDATFSMAFTWQQCVGSTTSSQIPGAVGGWSGYGGGYYGGGPIVGTCGNWPTADAINHRISLSESANGRTSPLDGLGSTFISLAQHYAINPGVVTAILQRESQLGSDGSLLPSTANNFGGVTGSGPCGSITSGSHDFAVYCSAAQGLEAVFQTLDKDIYRNTGGRLSDVMNIYSPPYENDVADMWNIFSVVASDLGITLGPDTQVFADETCTQANPVSGGQPIPAPPPGAGYGGYTTMFEYVLHQANCVISQGPWGPYSHQICDCYDFAVVSGTPVYPVAPGTVILSESTDGVYTPNHIIIQTAWGPLHYAHFTQRLVNVGDVVGLETLIGYSGSAGTGPHIHLGLEGGAANSPYGYTLTQTFAAIGFNINGFPFEY